MASANGSTECSSGNGSVVPQWKRDLIQRRRQQNKVLTSNGASVKLCSAVTGTFGNNNNGSSTIDTGISLNEPVVERFSLVASSIGVSQENQDQRVNDDGVSSSSNTLATRTQTPDSISSCSEYSSSSCQSFQQQHQLPLVTSLRVETPSGATVYHHENLDGTTVGEREGTIDNSAINSNRGVSSVVCNMRLETDSSSLCPSSEDAPNCNSTRNNHTIIGERGNVEFENYENEDRMKNYANGGGGGGVGGGVGVNNKRTNRVEQDSELDNCGRASRIIRRMDEKITTPVVDVCCLYNNASEQTRKSRIDKVTIVEDKKFESSGNGKIRLAGDECESDSSEELQYGPGIVNRLKSKYLNLTLREMKVSRVAVQRFRRAASLEDLLDCDDGEQQSDKTTRKYAKRNSAGITVAKGDRYRNASRGNESMKRARSVETLMRYNVVGGGGGGAAAAAAATPVVLSDENIQPNRFVTLRPGSEPVNDHIVLIDRTTVKIENRLSDPDRPKAINKPKRIKPLLAETERPPPDLVKTTMRLFEGSVKKFKPKGEVAVKVATFKTINDTYKAQNMKKIVPKPPIQPKPFVNGNNKMPSSPKKPIIMSKPTAELIENPDCINEYRNDCVVTEPIVQSVSSVVSKFQQIEKSYTPSASPEPNYKLKLSPAPSPEPPLLSSKLNKSNESLVVKSPPLTPTPLPRISSPGGETLPVSPKRADSIVKQHSNNPVNTITSPSKESLRQTLQATQVEKVTTRNEEKVSEVDSPQILENNDDDDDEHDGAGAEMIDDELNVSSEVDHPLGNGQNLTQASEDNNEYVTRTISKHALENISKAGSTMQYNFGDKSSCGKSYLPGVEHNGQKSETSTITRAQPTNSRPVESTKSEIKKIMSSPVPTEVPSSCSPISIDSFDQQTTPGYSKPIGAISSLGTIKSSSSPISTNISGGGGGGDGGGTSTPYPSCNDSKTIRGPKNDTSPPQKQIGIIRPLVSTKTQIAQQNLSNRELEKNLINRVKSIEQPTKVVVSLKSSAEEIQAVKKNPASPTGAGGAGVGAGLWDTKPWNQANNTMVFNFSNRKDVPDYIENDGLIIRRKREKSKVNDGGVIVLDATLDASTTDDSDWEISGDPPSPCDVSFTNDNVLINGRSNLSKQPRNHKHRIQFDDGATRTFEYPSEASLLEDEGTSVDGETSSTGGQEQLSQEANKSSSVSSAATMSSALLGGHGGLANFTPSKVDLVSEGFELGITRANVPAPPVPTSTSEQQQSSVMDDNEEEYVKSADDAAAWGAEATADLLY